MLEAAAACAVIAKIRLTQPQVELEAWHERGNYSFNKSVLLRKYFQIVEGKGLNTIAILIQINNLMEFKKYYLLHDLCGHTSI